MRNGILLLALILAQTASLWAQPEMTVIKVSPKPSDAIIDPNIYGQMLEDCNDNVIYGGLINDDGRINNAANKLMRGLNIPVVRWPGGTCIYEYDWRDGIGPVEKRPIVKAVQWGGVETNLFGTDEFLKWCDDMDIAPYINLNMGNNPLYPSSLGDALDWMEYVNGSDSTVMGRWRTMNGHAAPYNVRYWCIGNENYLTSKVHKAETADEYANKLSIWARTIKSLYPETSLLGVGHYVDWNDTVMKKSGKYIDYLTLHFYAKTYVSNDSLEHADRTLFATVRAEQNIMTIIERLDKTNKIIGRTSNPVRLCIDEWNNRHFVFNGKGYDRLRKDERRVFDIPVVASMLNIFIRNCKHIGMANYIFPINGHGLIKTINATDAYKTPLYDVFCLYGKWMKGSMVPLEVSGPCLERIDTGDLLMEGDTEKSADKANISATYIDAAASTEKGRITVAIVNRSHDATLPVMLQLPKGYSMQEVWKVDCNDINATNTPLNRERIKMEHTATTSPLTLLPCGFMLVVCQK